MTVTLYEWEFDGVDVPDAAGLSEADRDKVRDMVDVTVAVAVRVGDEELVVDPELEGIEMEDDGEMERVPVFDTGTLLDTEKELVFVGVIEKVMLQVAVAVIVTVEDEESVRELLEELVTDPEAENVAEGVSEGVSVTEGLGVGVGRGIARPRVRELEGYPSLSSCSPSPYDIKQRDHQKPQKPNWVHR